MATGARSSVPDPVSSATNWSFEEQSAQWRAARTACIYSLHREGDTLVLQIPPSVPYDELRYLVILGQLSTELLTIDYDTYTRFYPQILWRLARAFPKMLTSPSGWRYLRDGAKISRKRGDARISVPVPYITPYHTPGRPDPFGDVIIDRLAALEGRLFSAEELGSIITKLRIETLGCERFRDYLKGTR
jgi:hypothetical protein